MDTALFRRRYGSSEFTPQHPSLPGRSGRRHMQLPRRDFPMTGIPRGRCRPPRRDICCRVTGQQLSKRGRHLTEAERLVQASLSLEPDVRMRFRYGPAELFDSIGLGSAAAFSDNAPYSSYRCFDVEGRGRRDGGAQVRHKVYAPPGARHARFRFDDQVQAAQHPVHNELEQRTVERLRPRGTQTWPRALPGAVGEIGKPQIEPLASPYGARVGGSLEILKHGLGSDRRPLSPLLVDLEDAGFSSKIARAGGITGRLRARARVHPGASSAFWQIPLTLQRRRSSLRPASEPASSATRTHTSSLSAIPRPRPAASAAANLH